MTPTREQLIEMANEAGFSFNNGIYLAAHPNVLERFATRVLQSQGSELDDAIRLLRAIVKGPNRIDVQKSILDFLHAPSIVASPPPPAEQQGATCGGREPLPERDASKTAEQQGVFRKFEVKRTDGSDQAGGKHEGCEYFVLDVDHDPHAQDALYAYTLSCRHTHPQLSKDMIERYDLVPPAEQAQGSDARDAARYRWLIDPKRLSRVVIVDGAEVWAASVLSEVIDAAIATESKHD